MVQVPGAINVTVPLATVQTLVVVVLKVTAIPDVAVAVNANASSIANRSAGAANVIVCAVADIAVMRKDCVTLGDDA
jgi:hypothetical protein